MQIGIDAEKDTLQSLIRSCLLELNSLKLELTKLEVERANDKTPQRLKELEQDIVDKEKEVSVIKFKAEDEINLLKKEMEEKDIESISFKAGVKASYVLKTLVGKLKLPVAVFETRRDHTYTEAVTVSGGLMKAIEQYAEVCGVSAYINKRKVYVRHLSEGDDLGFTVNVDTGLLESPEEFAEEAKDKDSADAVKGLRFKMLLEHRITTASIVTLKSRDYSGKYRVREGKHVCNDADFYTEITAIE